MSNKRKYVSPSFITANVHLPQIICSSIEAGIDNTPTNQQLSKEIYFDFDGEDIEY